MNFYSVQSPHHAAPHASTSTRRRRITTVKSKERGDSVELVQIGMSAVSVSAFTAVRTCRRIQASFMVSGTSKDATIPKTYAGVSVVSFTTVEKIQLGCPLQLKFSMSLSLFMLHKRYG